MFFSIVVFSGSVSGSHRVGGKQKSIKIIDIQHKIMKFSDGWISATPAPISMVLGVLESSDRVLSISNNISDIFGSVGGSYRTCDSRNNQRPTKMLDFRSKIDDFRWFLLGFYCRQSDGCRQPIQKISKI